MGKRLAVVVNWPYEMIPWSFWASLWNSDVRKEEDVLILRPVSPNPSLSQNMAIKTGLSYDADEFLFCDVDQDVPRDILARFRAHDKDVVAALTALRQYPHQWGMFNFTPDGERRTNVKPTERLQKVDVASGGVILLKAEVFKKIPPPWFATDLTEDGCDVASSSEFHFFRKAKAHGIEVYIDTTLEAPHHTDLLLHSVSLGRKIDYLEVHGAEVKEDVLA